MILFGNCTETLRDKGGKNLVNTLCVSQQEVTGGHNATSHTLFIFPRLTFCGPAWPPRRDDLQTPRDSQSGLVSKHSAVSGGDRLMDACGR